MLLPLALACPLALFQHSVAKSDLLLLLWGEVCGIWYGVRWYDFESLVDAVTGLRFFNRWTVGILNAVFSVFALAGIPCPPPWSLLSLVSGLVLSPTLTGMPCPPPWFCLSLVSGLVSQLASHVGWDAVSVFWACLQNFICDLCNCLGSTVV